MTAPPKVLALFRVMSLAAPAASEVVVPTDSAPLSVMAPVVLTDSAPPTVQGPRSTAPRR